MKDGYLDFANSPMGAKLINALGLPKPLPLDRYTPGQAVITGPVLVGGGGDEPQLLEALARFFKSIGAQTLAHERLPQWVSVANAAGLTTGRWALNGEKGEKVKALVFDATGLTDSTQSDALYWFFHDAARSLLPCGRVIVLGRPPEECSSPRQAAIQRALEGLTRSLGKELKKGSNAQLVYVSEGAEDQIESTLRFLISPRSAYVSAQVIRVRKAVGTSVAPADWSQSLAGKKVLVTGASRGIGAAIAEVMAREGAHVIALDVPQAQAGLDEVAKKIGGHGLGHGHRGHRCPAKVGRRGFGTRWLGRSGPQRWYHPRQNHCQHEGTPLANGGEREPVHPRAHQRSLGFQWRHQIWRPHRLRVVHLRHCRQHGPDQLCRVQSRCDRHGSRISPDLCCQGHHDQCRGPWFH